MIHRLQLLLVAEGADIVTYIRGVTGELTKQGVAATLPEAVSSLAVSPDRHHLFVVVRLYTSHAEALLAVSAAVSVLHGGCCCVVAQCGSTRVKTFCIDAKSGALKPLGTEAALTDGAAFISTDKSGRFLLTAS